MIFWNFHRTHRSVEEKLDTSTKRMETVESELRHREKELDEANHQRAQLQKEVHALRANAKGKHGHTEVLILKTEYIVWFSSQIPDFKYNLAWNTSDTLD